MKKQPPRATSYKSSSLPVFYLISILCVRDIVCAIEQVAQRSCGCPLPGSVQGQAGWGFEQPGLGEGVPAHGRGVRLDDL